MADQFKSVNDDFILNYNSSLNTHKLLFILQFTTKLHVYASDSIYAIYVKPYNARLVA